MPSKSCILNQTAPGVSSIQDNSSYYFDKREFVVDDDNEIKIYGIPRGAYRLICGNFNMWLRIDGQGFKRYTNITPSNGKQHFWGTPFFN